ncbi:MAG: rod shape-determining protein MreC [Chitinophagaceae bacterium]|nr:rod shape-determining protein MreC [Bacteroidota bacterium]MCC6258857.1 rod shape-determining protein MreC [Chitinophagaceae bacterium]MCW5916090.1 rod shape-determining protein MreC [Ferruginibacter sp.]
MRNIFLFISRHFNLLFCLLLQGFAIYLIVHYSKYHEAVFGETANQVTGQVNKQFNNFSRYFKLKRINDSLANANEMLYNKLRQDFEIPDSIPNAVIDTLRIDSLTKYRKFTYRTVKVVANSVAQPNNFIILSSGTGKGLRVGMGIITPGNAVIGIITSVSNDYAVVMSLLHKDTRLSGKLKRTGETGTISWNGQTPNILNMSNVPKSAKVVVGDTVITSGFSTSFPAGLLIGRVEEIFSEKSTNNFLIKLRSFADFNNLNYGYAIDNAQQISVDRLLDSLKKSH